MVMGSGSNGVSFKNEDSVIIVLLPNNRRNIDRQYCIIFLYIHHIKNTKRIRKGLQHITGVTNILEFVGRLYFIQDICQGSDNDIFGIIHIDCSNKSI
jgi:hypothetical protein